MASSRGGGSPVAASTRKRTGLLDRPVKWLLWKRRGARPRADGQSNADICTLAAFRPTVSVVLSTGRSNGFQVSPTTRS